MAKKTSEEKPADPTTKSTLKKEDKETLARTAARKAKFLKMYQKKRALISHAATAAGIDRGTFYDWKKADPVFKKACEEIEEGVGDWVEEKIHDRMEKNDTTMLIYYSKTKLKSRGYIERVEQVNFDGSVKVTVPGESTLPEFTDEK